MVAARSLGAERVHVGPARDQRPRRLDLRPFRGARPSPEGARLVARHLDAADHVERMKWPDDGEIDIYVRAYIINR